MTPCLINCQQRDVVPIAWLGRVARGAVRCLKIQARGQLAIAFVDSPTMRTLNRRFMHHEGLTDVLTFRYRDEPMLGEVLVAPAFARWYAKRHGLSYRQELARYVIHGLLHWIGHDDRTAGQRRNMRVLEEQLLKRCA